MFSMKKAHFLSCLECVCIHTVNTAAHKGPKRVERIRPSLTCPRRQEPAVEIAGCQRVVEHQPPLAVDRLQDLVDGHWGVGVRVLLTGLPFYQQVSEGPSAASLGHRQRFVMVT